MFDAVRKKMRAVAIIAVAAALAVGGVAAAQGGSSNGGGSGSGQATANRPPGPPPMGIGTKDLTYAELHVRNSEGESETIRLDQGKVKSVSGDSLTITENDGSDVTVAVDDDTAVLGKPGAETSLGDLEAGQKVSVTAPDGEAADAIMVLPKKGDLPHGAPGGPMGPPPGADPRREQSSE